MNHLALETEILRKVHQMDFSHQKEVMHYVNNVAIESTYKADSYRKKAIKEIRKALHNL